MHPLPDHTQTFLHNLFEALADRHDFADGLHARTNLAVHADELRQVPARNLDNHVVHLRSLVRRVRCPHLADFVQAIAQRQLSSHESQRIARSLRCQSRRAAQASIHLDDTVIVRLRVEGILDVAFAHDTEVADRLPRQVLQPSQFGLRQRTRRGNDDTFARMHAQRVHIFHTYYGEAVVVLVADDFELNLLPALQGFFDEDLRSVCEGTFRQFAQLGFILADAATHTAEGIRRANHNRITDACCRSHGIFHRLDRLAHRRLDVDFLQFLDKQVAVFRVHDRFDGRTEDLHAVFGQRPARVQLRPAVQRRLSAESQQDAVGLFFLNHFLHKIGSNRQEVNLVCHAFRCLNRRNVRIQQNRADAFFP